MTVDRFATGQPVRRKEDQRFITGTGRYLDDIVPEGQLHAKLLRSPHAHAGIGSIDVSAARAAPGVVAVLTGDDVLAAGLGPIPCGSVVQNSADGSDCFVPERHALAVGRVRFVGEAVALVVAETPDAARDAIELIEVDFDDLPATIATGAAMTGPQLYEGAPNNVCVDWDNGDKAAADAAFETAHHVTVYEHVNNRVVVAPIEPRGCIGVWDADEETFTLYNSGQAAHNVAGTLARAVFNVPTEKLRVISPDVGGGFGTKNFIYPEQALVLLAAKQIGRPVKWVAERTEGFVSDTQGRDHVMRAELALDADGKFLALRIDTVANIGAYVSTFGARIPTTPVAVVVGGVYDIPAAHYRVRAVFSNTVPVDAYRGAGRPEAAYAIERLVDLAAAETGVDPIELRRRNFIPRSRMPYKTAMGSTLDSGDFGLILDRCLEEADHAGFAARRAESEARGLKRGFGVACYFEATLGLPNETTAIRFESDGTATVVAGTMSNGQGHETTYAQLLHERLGIDFDAIGFLQGDTGQIPSGGGHGGSRSMQIGGNALMIAAEKVEEKARRIAAHRFEAQIEDVELRDGACRVVGTDLSIGLMELAALARDPASLPEGMEPGLDASGDYTRSANTFPNGCHACEVEVDPATGIVRVARYHVVDDFGRLLNPMIVAGQVHGGVVQGIGQALLEHTVFDEESGQLLSGSFMDYTLPRAGDMPDIPIVFESVPTETNELGVKGCGEAGCIGALPVTINALADALSSYGIRDVEMPATPERVWRAIRRASEAAA